tara:strand:+ start:252 stop:989 length:738 start_codon:yes stop_codon:yes gene_type:complete
MIKNIKIIIPSRYKSSRFPGKPLAKLLGKEMIIRVGEICAKVTSRKNIIIATDDKRILDVCKKYNFLSLITPKSCLTGTDRVFHASKKYKNNIIINVQGDEPLIKPKDIIKIYNAKKKFKDHVICGYTLSNLKEAKNINTPKVILDKFSNLIYMSRALIPGTKNKKNIKKIKFLKQVSIYAFNFKELQIFAKSGKKGYLESFEDIEILRFLEFGKSVKMIKLNKNSQAVDVKSDVNKVTKILKLK